MKTNFFISLILTFSLFSCSNNDSSEEIQNPIQAVGLTFDGVTYGNLNGKAVDNYHFYSNIHSEYYFVFSDGIINITAIPGSVCGFTATNATIAVQIDVACFGNTFLPGTYNFYNGFTSSGPNSNFFNGLKVRLDKNGNHSVVDFQDKVLYATAGTIVVSGTGPNYTLAINVTLNDGSNLQYTYNSGFTYIDNRDN